MLTGQTGFSPRPVTYPAQMSTVSPGCYACYCATFSSLRLHSEQANVVKICFWSNVPVFCYPFKSTTDAVFKGNLTTWGGNMEIVPSCPLSWVAHQLGKPDSTHQLPYWHKEVKVSLFFKVHQVKIISYILNPTDIIFKNEQLSTLSGRDTLNTEALDKFVKLSQGSPFFSHFSVIQV